MWGELAYQGHSDLIGAKAPRVCDCSNRCHQWGARIDEAVKAKNRNKSRVRVKVARCIGVIKRIFGFQTVRYRGRAKNLHRLESAAAMANLFAAVQRRLLATWGSCR
ncbi:MAG: hypothetical protein M0Z85_01440 [Gammaproteobacteria bacterium]|nr:hypothetical protein [Gammaproteobacteria bacterium]